MRGQGYLMVRMSEAGEELSDEAGAAVLKFFFAFWLALLPGRRRRSAAPCGGTSRASAAASRPSAIRRWRAGLRAAMAVSAAAAVLGHGGRGGAAGLARRLAWRGSAALLTWWTGRPRAARPRGVGGGRRRCAPAGPLAEPRRPARQVATADGQAYLLFIPADAVGRWARLLACATAGTRRACGCR